MIRLGRIVLFLLLTPAVAGAETVSVAVMEFTSKGGVTQDQMDALSDMLAKEIESLGDFRVIGKSDISSMLSLEEQKQRLNACDDQACLAEIGGALGVRWVVVGNVSLFGETYLLNMKLIDVEKAQVAGRVSRSITGGESNLIAELPSGAQELFQAVAERLGIKTPVKIEKKEPAEEDRPAEAVSAKAGGEWFTRSVGRMGRWYVSAYTGGGMFPEVNITSGDATEEDLSGALWALDSERQVFKAAASGGYYLFDWLSVGIQLGYLRGSGNGWYEEYTCDGTCTQGWTGDLRRTRWAVELGGEIRAAWPFDFWIEPVASLAMGFNWMSDDTPESFYPDGLDSGTIEVQCSGFLLDAGIGADFYLYSHWRVGVMFYYLFRIYGNIEGDGYRMQGSRMLTQGGVLVFNTGWIF
jgi:TolB-like protein